MKCLSCGTPSDEGKILCDQCSLDLDASLTNVLDRASKEKIEAYQIEITEDGVLLLISDTVITYMGLTENQWAVFKDYLLNVTFKRGKDEKG